ncbi:MAG: hypothetical protein WBC91_07935 [Phototrophicaceae bacterium]
MHRMLIVILGIASMLLVGCQQSEGPSDEDIAAIIGDIEALASDRLVYDISLELQWVMPNPRNAWALVGREIQAIDQVSTRILIRLEPKTETGQGFEEALMLLTASDLIFGETDTGERYARGTSAMSNYVMYRDFDTVVVVLTLTDLLVDVIDPIYVADWETIALDGGLFVLD